MESAFVPIEVPVLPLRVCSVEEHCATLIRSKCLSYWWYQGTSKIFGNYSLPFQDNAGNWWQQMKPGLCWPVESFKPIDPKRACPPWRKSYVGYQHLVPDAASADSRMVINAIFDLNNYGAHLIASKRRSKIRKGFRNCALEVLSAPHKETFDACRAIWDDLSARTAWKQPAKEKQFDEQWRTLLDCPGVTIILAREKNSGQLAGFYITKILGDTAYSDTIAVHTDKLHLGANDVLRYAYLVNASKLKGVTKASSSIVSTIKGLEQFKRAVGFKPYAFPAHTYLRLGMSCALNLGFHRQYKRMLGQFEDDDQICNIDNWPSE